MGGSAFLTHRPPLSTPRMPPSIYALILSQTLGTLRQHYTHVSSSIQAPEKPSYGDIDILAFGPLSSAFDTSLTPKLQVVETIAKELDAKAWIVGNGDQPMNLAVPWPLVLPDITSAEETIEPAKEEKFVQIDLHICKTSKALNWELFHSAHGDLWNILGSTIRRFGLTVNNRGLFLRIPSIELLDRKKSLVHLTDEPTAILEFIGLDAEKWWMQFRTREEMFEYAAGCRMFWIREEMEVGEMEGDVVGEVPRHDLSDGTGGEIGGLEGRKKLKHNDRQRMNKRPIFAAWIDEFIPRAREEGRFDEARTTREEIRDEAFARFGDAVKIEYENREKEWLLERHRDELWRTVIKGSVPEDVEPQFRSASIRLLKGIIMEGKPWDGGEKGGGGGQVVKAAERNEEGFWDIGEATKFVQDNWKKAGELGMVEQGKRAMEVMKAKAEKKRVEAEAKARGASGKEVLNVAAT